MGKKQDKKDLPRGLQIDTTTGPFDFDEEEKIMVPKKKPVKAFLGLAAMGLAGAMGAKKLMKKNKVASLLSPASNLLMKDEKKSKDQKETGDVKTMSIGGEVSVGKGSDYIKDLI
jgi:hypothetical protein